MTKKKKADDSKVKRMPGEFDEQMIMKTVCKPGADVVVPG